MPKIHRELIVPYSSTQMFALVDDIENYPAFIPWCVSSRVLDRDDGQVSASLAFAKSGMQKSFSTKNRLLPPNTIIMTLLEGPFKHLEGIWQFNELPQNQCQIVLDLEFEFANRILSMMFGPVFNHVAQSMVGSFSEQAKEVYVL